VAKGPEKRDIRFSMRMPASLHARLGKVAMADRRTMADFVIIVLEEAIERFEAAQRDKAKSRV